MKVMYQGVDITRDISVNRCTLTMYAAGHSDEMVLRCNDVRRLWDSWGPQRGDVVRVSDDMGDTGDMFVHGAVAEAGAMTIRAFSMPPGALTRNNKTWNAVHFSQLCAEIAQRQGLPLDMYGVTDRWYQLVSQNGEGDFDFLHRRCLLEGAAFLVYDRRLVVYDERTAEAAAPVAALTVANDGKYRYGSSPGRLYDQAVVTNGRYTGRAGADGDCPLVHRRWLEAAITDQAEANRFAANLLRDKSKAPARGILWNVNVPVALAPGSVLNLETPGAAGWDGPVFLERVRRNMGQQKAKLWFRRVHGGEADE